MASRRDAVLLGFLLAACGPPGAQQEVEFRVPVTAGEVGTARVEDRIVTTGTLRAAESVVLVAESPGRLQVARDNGGRRLAEGDSLRAGQDVAAITGEDARLAARSEATLRRYRLAEQELASRRRLFEAGMISEQDVRQAEASLADAQHDWERSQLTEDRMQLVTPIAGVLLKLARDGAGLPVADGQLVVPGFEVAQVAPLGRLIADVDLVGPELGRVRTGMPARLRHFAWQGQVFAGRVLRLAPSLDPHTHTFRAEVEVANPLLLLRPGMFVEVTLVIEVREQATVVPRPAVTERGGVPVVFKLNGQRVSSQEVILGLGDDEVVEVRQGLAPGERIVVRGLETLTDDTRVRVVGGDAASSGDEVR